MVGVKEIARLAGVIGSFTLVMGNVARFYTRGMLTQVAEMSGRDGWQCSGRMERRVLDEILLWVKNLRVRKTKTKWPWFYQLVLSWSYF